MATTDSNTIYAVEGETYRFPSVHSSGYNYADCMVNISFNKGEVDTEFGYFPDYLASYSLPGYEWRKIDVSATTDAPASSDPFAIDASKADFIRIRSCDYDDTYVSAADFVWETIDENGWVRRACTFTAIQDGKEYPGCQVFETWEYGTNDYSNFSWYALIPQGFTERVSVGYCGAKLENGQTVPNEASPDVLFNF